MEQARAWSPRVISKFETLIKSADDHSRYRVNPLAFARDRAIAQPEAIDLFLHAARCGLFDMSWGVLCPQSGMVLDSFGALRTLKTHYVCGLCDVSGDTDLDVAVLLFEPSLLLSAASGLSMLMWGWFVASRNPSYCNHLQRLRAVEAVLQ